MYLKSWRKSPRVPSTVPLHLLVSNPPPQARAFSTISAFCSRTKDDSLPLGQLTHLTSSGAAHMVSISYKQPTARSATATTTLYFSSPTTHPALTSATLKKGDAIAVARIAGIQAAKRTSDLIPLAHPGLQITGISVDIEPFGPSATASSEQNGVAVRKKDHGGVRMTATVDCEGKTGVEMEALTAAQVAGLTMYDMLKGMDKGMWLGEGRVLRKTGGKSGGWTWDEEEQEIVRVDERKK